MSKKVLQKLTAITTAAIMAASAIPMTASAAWNKDANANWQWTENGSKSTGWKNIHGNWYYFNGAGVMQTGWNFVNGQWYYFNESGSMQTGWNFVDGEWYLLGANGAMAKGWQKEGNTWYHLNENGVMSRHWRKLNDKWYHFSPSGQMSTGWVNWKDDYYFCSQDGTMQSGVVEINNKIYYFDEVTGNMKTGRIKIDGVTYNFGPDGAATGSLLPKAQKAFNTNGVATTPSIPNNGGGSNRPSGGGGGIGDGSFVEVNNVSLDQRSARMEAGDDLILIATVSPYNATDKTVYWKSSDERIAIVNSAGRVSALKSGNVTITATAGRETATCDIEVLSGEIKATSIAVTSAGSKTEVYYDDTAANTLQLTATITPANASLQSVTWSSSSPAVAKVNDSGLVTGLTAGTATITASAKDGSGVKGTFVLTVSKKPTQIVKVTGITVTQAQSKTEVEVDSTLPLGVTVSPSNATNKGVTWTSSNSAFATVNASGVVTGVKAGSVTITATAADGSGVRGTYAITVNAAVVAAKPTFTTNLPTAKTVAIGTELKLTVAASVTDGGKLSYRWYKGADEIANATSASYTVAKAAASDGGDYQCIVTNTKGTATASADSEVCKVTISDPKNALMGVPFTTAVGRDNFAYYSTSFDNPNFANWLTDGDAPLTGTADALGHIMHAAPGNNDTDYTFDWGTEKTIKQITISSIAGQVWYPEDGVPDHIRIQAKVKGVWTEVFNKTGLRGTGASKKFVFGVEGNGEILATGLKFEFFPRIKPAGAVHLTEIEALVDAPASGVKQDGQMIAPDISGFAKLPVIDKDVEDDE
ncbi:MAG: Ig-like domain-containing protein [Oscillospiraceae bacterium]